MKLITSNAKRQTSNDFVKLKALDARRSALDDNSGYVLIAALILTSMFLLVAIAVAEFSANHYSSARRSLIALNALQAAEAGAESFMYNLNLDGNYQGTTNAPSGTTDSCTGFASTPVTLTSHPIQGKLTYESCVKNGTIANEKVIIATGKVYVPTSATTPKTTRKVKLIVTSSTGSGYTVQTGPGGLILNQNVSINTGPVYIGGKLQMKNNSRIGTVALPVAVYAQDMACPWPASALYPLLCGSGQGDPPHSITIANGAHIYGEVHATNSIDNPSRATNPGLVDSIVPPVVLPPDNHTVLTSTINAVNRSDNGSCSNGTTWAANTHFTGDVSLANNCSITVNGDIWISGNFNMGNNAVLTVGSSLASPPKIIIDGQTGFNPGNNAALVPNAALIGFRMITFFSYNAGGTGPSSCNPNCITLTGTELAASQTKTTINISNNFSAAIGTTFYSRWTKLYVGNNTTVGALLGQLVELNNNGNIIFGSTAGTGATTWSVKYYEQIFN